MTFVFQLWGKILIPLLCFHVFTGSIQGSPKTGVCPFTWSMEKNPAAHAPLCRKADMPSPPARAVVETSHSHGAENVRNIFALNDLLTAGRVDAVVRQCGAHASELSGVHAD